MNALQKIGGVLLAAIVLIALIAGFSTSAGRSAGSDVLSAGRTLVAETGDWIDRYGRFADVGGNLGRALVIGLVIFTTLILLVPAARGGRGFAAAAFGSALIALLLFQPSIGTSLRDAVSAPTVRDEVR